MSNQELIAELSGRAEGMRRKNPSFAQTLDAAVAALEQSTPRNESAYLQARERAAFALYKADNPESVAENFETVGLPIVLRYREKAEATLVAAGFGRLPVVETVGNQSAATVARIERYLERFNPGGTHGQNVMAQALTQIIAGAGVAWAPSDSRFPVEDGESNE